MKRAIISFGASTLIYLFVVGSAKAGPISFSDVTESAMGERLKKQGIGAAFSDYDNDGDMDMYLTHAFNGPVLLNRISRLWENNGSGQFSNVAAEKGVDQIVPWTEIGCDNPDIECQDRSGLGRGISWGDCDNDGDLDLLVANMDSSDADPPVPLTTLYINSGAPNFEFTWETCDRGVHRRGEQCTDNYRGGIAATSGGITWGDYNNDGCLDFYWRCADWHIDNALFQNVKRGGRCTCTFTEVTWRSGVKLLYPLRLRSVVVKANSQGNANWVDYDNDGDLDLFNPNEGDANVLFRNEGNGTFTEVTTTPGLEGNGLINNGDAEGACWGDIDNDGDLDCYLPNAGQANRLIRNDLIENGNVAGFTDITMQAGEAGDFGDVRGCTMGDYDNDGDLDIYLNNGGDSNVYFNDVQDVDPMQTQFYVADSPGNNSLLRNNGDSTFTNVTEGSGGNVYGEGRGVATGDYDDDGLLDLYVTALYVESDPPGDPDEFEGVLLKNTTENSNNWVKVELVGTASNRSGIGARVNCTTPSFTQVREVASATGYNSQDDPRAHFGLGSDSTITSLEITWPKPNFAVQSVPNPVVNKIYICTEGSGCVEK